MKKINLLGVNVDLINSNQLIEEITNLPKKGSRIIGHANVKSLNLSYEEKKYQDFFRKCDVIFCDGVGVLLGARLLGYKVKFDLRMTCPDYLDTLLQTIINKNQSIYFLAGRSLVSNTLSEMLATKYPTLNFRTHHGHFEKKGNENRKVINDINEFNPDILYVGFGMPLQEYWLVEHMGEINTKVFLPLGACLDFYTGHVYRGPRWLTDNGFEWLTRFATEPRRLWRRYLIGNPLFFLRVIKEIIRSAK